MQIKYKILKKQNLRFLLVLSFIFVLQFLFLWEFITSYDSLFASDPLYWFDFIYHVKESGYFETNVNQFYPEGYTLFCIACLSLLQFPNFELTYHFMKYMPIPLFLLFILVVALILRRIFKKNYIVFLGLMLTITANYLNHRFLQFIPSNLATLFILISLLIFLADSPNYLISLFVILIYFLHPLAGFIYGLALVYYVLIKFLYYDRKLKFFFKELLKAFIFIFFLILPYAFFLLSFNKDLRSFINSYLDIFGLPTFSNVITNSSNNNILLFIDFSSLRTWIIEVLTNWAPDYPPWDKNRLIGNSIIFSYFFIFALIGLFIPSKKSRVVDKRDVILFGKGVLITILIFFFLPVIYPGNFIQFLFPLSMILRVLEFFCVPIVIMTCYSVLFFIKYIKNFKIKSKIFNKLRKKSKLFRVFNFQNIFIAFLICSTFLNYPVDKKTPGYPWQGGYYFNDDQISTIFYIRENIIHDSSILVSSFISNPGAFNALYYHLLWDYNFTLWDYSIPNCYNITKNYLYQKNISYLLIDNYFIDETQLNYFIVNNNNFKIIYENSRNILFQTTGNLSIYLESGIYDSTWNFLSEEDGDIGYDIDFINYYINSSNCSASIKSRVDDHSKVLHLSNNNEGYILVNNYLGWYKKSTDIIENGTIEFWWRTEDTNQESSITFYGNSTHHIFFRLRIFRAIFQYYNGSSWNDIISVNNNSWYHLRIDFECGNKNYMGLMEDTLNLYINMSIVLNGTSFIKNVNNLQIIRVYTEQSYSSFNTYFDAFGYSWDNNYRTGENLKNIYL